MTQKNESLTFWDHLEVLRGVILRSLLAVFIFSVITFIFKDWLFGIVFAPSRSDFILYRLFHIPEFHVSFINTELASQFLVHLEVSLLAGIVLASPLIVAELYRFISPALYSNERRYSIRLTFSAVLLFIIGVLITYFIIFPFAFHFLATYEVNPAVVNQISLRSYVSTLLILCLMMGLLFEMPVVAYFLAKMGILHAEVLRKYRRHAIVALTILAAIITPTGDAFTLLLVTLPLYLLYELSIFVIKRI